MQQNHCHIRFHHAHRSFNLIAIETAGTWNAMAVELVQKIGRRVIVLSPNSQGKPPFRSNACAQPFNRGMRSLSKTQ